jgi:hypothetical protein
MRGGGGGGDRQGAGPDELVDDIREGSERLLERKLGQTESRQALLAPLQAWQDAVKPWATELWGVEDVAAQSLTLRVARLCSALLPGEDRLVVATRELEPALQQGGADLTIAVGQRGPAALLGWERERLATALREHVAVALWGDAAGEPELRLEGERVELRGGPLVICGAHLLELDPHGGVVYVRRCSWTEAGWVIDPPVTGALRRTARIPQAGRVELPKRVGPAPLRRTFFLAYPSPERARARELRRALGERGHSVFFDADDVIPGQAWDDVLPEALAGCQVVVVLVGPATQKAHYERDEVATAIARWRKHERPWVVPVALGEVGAFQALPYGLTRLRGVVWDGLVGTVVTELERALEGVRATPVMSTAPAVMPTVPAVMPTVPAVMPTVPTDLHPPAVVRLPAEVELDRELQWRDLHGRLVRPAHQLFLLHGPPDQHLDGFLERVARHLSKPPGVPPVVVPADQRDHDRPTTRTIWKRRLGSALGAGPPELGMRERCAAGGALILLGLRPFEVGARGFRADVLEALAQLIEAELPPLLQAAPPGAGSLAFVVAVTEAEHGAGTWTDRVRRAMDTVWATGLAEFEDTTLRLGFRPTPEQWQELRALYDAHDVARDYLLFCQALDDLLNLQFLGPA